MKKLMCMLLVLLLTISLAACDLGKLPQGSNGDEQIEGGNENNPNARSGENGETNNTGEDDPPPVTNEKLVKLEKKMAELLGINSFSFGEGVTVDIATYTDNGVATYLACENADALIALVRQQIPSDYKIKDEYGVFSADKLVKKVYFDDWTDTKFYYNTVQILDFMGMVSLSVVSETAPSEDEAVNAYIKQGVPHSDAVNLVAADTLSPGMYNNDYRVYVCANGDVVRILDEDDVSRIRIMTHDLQFYDLHVGHLGDEYQTDYYRYDFSDRPSDFYALKSQTLGNMTNVQTITRKAYTDHVEVVEAIVGLENVELLDWGKLDHIYDLERVELYEQEAYYYYGQGWLDGYYATPIHECRDDDYLPESVKDKVVYTEVSRNNTYADRDHGVMYSVNTRRIVFDEDMMTEELIQEIISHWNKLGVAGEMKDNMIEPAYGWKGLNYVYTEYVDEQAFTKWDEYVIEWKFEDNSPADRYVEITITYWYHTIYV